MPDRASNDDDVASFCEFFDVGVDGAEIRSVFQDKMAAGGLFRFAMQRVFGFRFLAQRCSAADTSDHRQRENGKFELLTLHGKDSLKMCSSSNPSRSSNRN